MPKRILVADHERHVVVGVRDILRRAGYRVSEAADGREALEEIERHPPDLALLDVVLPKVDGAAVAQALRDRPETADIPVIFLTDLVSEGELRRRGSEIGGRHFLAKPFDAEQLLDLIELVLPAN
jgi:DNA-binding response OmpR family regulator